MVNVHLLTSAWHGLRLGRSEVESKKAPYQAGGFRPADVARAGTATAAHTVGLYSCPDQSGGGPPHSRTLARGVTSRAKAVRLDARRTAKKRAFAQTKN